jgi:RNA polymerase sigma-70 factor (ECF subfamily)
LADEPDDVGPPALSVTERTLLAAYIEHFNARFTNYAKASPRHFELGFVDGRPAMLVYEAVAPDVVSYFVVLQFTGSNVVCIRDFLYAPYALDGAVLLSSRRRSC